MALAATTAAVKITVSATSTTVLTPGPPSTTRVSYTHLTLPTNREV